MMNNLFKSILEQDSAPIVVCDLNHIIVYMVALRDDNGALIGYYEKHEYRNRETTGFYEAVR